MFENITVRKLNLNHESFLSKKACRNHSRLLREVARSVRNKDIHNEFFHCAATIEANFKRYPANTRPQFTPYGE